MHDNSPEGYDILGTTNGLPQITWLRCKGCRALVAGRDEVEHRMVCDLVTAPYRCSFCSVLTGDLVEFASPKTDGPYRACRECR